MSSVKKAFVIMLAICMVITVVSCSQMTDRDAGSEEQTTKESVKVTTSIVTDKDTSEETTGIDETTTIDDSSNDIYGYDPITEKVGSYVTVEYNPMFCTISTKYKKDLGSKEKVELTVTMRDSYIFDGWSFNDYICNSTNPNYSTKEKYAFIADAEKKVFVNCSMTVRYETNGGLTKDGKMSLETTYSVSEYKCPSTLPDQGYFTREGYVLSEYNTEPDGSGEAVSMGSKIRSDSSKLTLYCIWLKTDDPSDFEYTRGSGITITGYKGNKKDVVIPEKIEGLNVTAIAKKAFTGLDIETVFLPKTIETLNRGSFYECSYLTSIVFFDSILTFYKDSIASCPNFKYVRINAVQDLYYDWMIGTYCKTDRLIWAADMKKFIFYGGSGTLHAIKCELVNEEIGDEYVVINYGANANVSAAFVFEGMKKWLKEEDIVLWCPEMSASPLGSADMTGSLGKRNIEIYVSGNYDFLKGIDVSKYEGFFDALMQVLSDHEKHNASWDMGSVSYNCYGDSVSSAAQKLFDNAYGFPSASNLSSYKRMQLMILELKDMGVETWFSYAVMDETGSGLTEAGAEKYEQNLKKYFDVTIISDFWDCMVPHECMADSKWHVTLEGADIRTKQVIKDILAQFEKEKND
ncbi:MAG: leucine-rich repeat protein [Clostridiales bacterium]|nr:leucine-rich repeat protein [Clostridiales bacterium]